MAVWIVMAVVVLPVVWAIVAYNRLVVLRNDVKNAWHQIDVQLKRRHDLIPNLVAVVKGYMEYEKDTIEKVVSARARAMSAATFSEIAASEIGLSRAITGLFAVMENYPVLKASANAMQLQEELTTTENRIAFARQLYNDLVADLVTRIEVFPDNLIASLFHIQGAEYFSADADDRVPPEADISVRPN